MRGLSPEADAQAKQSFGNVLDVFAARDRYEAAKLDKLAAEHAATCVAPPGYLIAITTLADGALSRVSHPFALPETHKFLPPDVTVHAPRISSTVFAGQADRHTTVTQTSWFYGPTNPEFDDDRSQIYQINNRRVRFGLIAVGKLLEQREIERAALNSLTHGS